MSHKATGIRPINPGHPGTGGGTGSTPVDQLDLQALRDDLFALIADQGDPLRFRRIRNADIVSLNADKITALSITAGNIGAGTITVPVEVGNSSIVLDGTTTQIRVNDGTRDRVIIGDLGSDFGIEVYNSAGTLMWSAATGAQSAGIATDAVTSIKIVNNAITETKVADDAITTPKVAANAITANEIATNAVTSDKILANAITAGKIAAGAVTADTIGTGTLTATVTVSGTIQTAASPNARIAITDTKLEAYDSSNRLTFEIDGGSNSQVRTIRSDGLDNILAESYSATAADGPRLTGKRARGSLSSPSGVSSEDYLVEVYGLGYHSGGAFGSKGPGIVGVATQSWTSSAQGSRIEFHVKTNGTTSNIRAGYFDQDAVLYGRLPGGSFRSMMYSLGQTTRRQVQESTANASLSSGGPDRVDVSITFPDSFSSQPAVVATWEDTDTDPPSRVGVSTASVSTSGFSARAWVLDSGTFIGSSGDIHWLACGQP